MAMPLRKNRINRMSKLDGKRSGEKKPQTHTPEDVGSGNGELTGKH